MSILNQTPTQSAEYCNANLPCNESTEAANDESAISDPTSLSPQCSNSGDILPTSLDLIDIRENTGNAVFRNPGQKSCYKDQVGRHDDNHRSMIGGNGYRHDQVRRHDVRPNYYRNANGYRHNHMPFPRPQPRVYRPPLIYPPMRPLPFIPNAFNPIWPANQGPFSFHYYVPSNVYRYSGQPQAQYYSGASLVPNYYQDIYAAQQSHFSILLENLRAKLRKQIEYYFCMENLCSDEYLRKHMDAQGWVPISLIAGFRKVEQLMKEKQSLYDSFGLCNAATRVDDKQSSSNIQFISDSLRPSLSVEVQGDKVRKRHEWEKWLWPSNSSNHSAD